MATPEQMEKKRSRQVLEILTVVETILIEIADLKAEIAGLKAEIGGLKFTAATSAPASRRTKK